MQTLMKRGALVLALIVVSMVIAACGDNGGGNGGGGGGSASNTPEGAAKAFWEAAYSGNAEVAKANACAAGQDMIDEAVAGMSAISASGATLDFSGLTYTKASESGDDATVSIGGALKVTVAGQTTEQPLGDSIPAIPLKREGGVWKVCGF